MVGFAGVDSVYLEADARDAVGRWHRWLHGERRLIVNGRLTSMEAAGDGLMRQGLRFRGMTDDDAVRLETILQLFAPWVRWEGRIWIAGDVTLSPREANAVKRLEAYGFSVEHDRRITHLPDDGTTTDVIVSTRDVDLDDAVLEVRSALPRRRVVGHESPNLRESSPPPQDTTAVCSACYGSEGLIVTGRLPLVCGSCLAVNDQDPADFMSFGLVS